MANTTSIAFPNMINVAQNQVAVYQDSKSIENRCALLIKTEPTEIYRNPKQGAGLKKFMWQYNNDTNRALLQQRILEQLREYEPCVNGDTITFADGDSKGSVTITQEYNKLSLTVIMETTFGDTVKLDLGDLIEGGEE